MLVLLADIASLAVELVARLAGGVGAEAVAHARWAVDEDVIDREGYAFLKLHAPANLPSNAFRAARGALVARSILAVEPGRAAETLCARNWALPRSC